MKKILFLLFAASLISFTSFAQEKTVTVKAGTMVSLESVTNVRASKVHEGQSIDFRETKDVVVNKVTVIPAGTIAKGTVYEAKRSSWWGTKGRLGIKVRSIIVPSGEELFFASSEVYITGKNRTPLSVVTALFVWPCMFICGSKAEMKAGYEFDAPLASTTTITVE